MPDNSDDGDQQNPTQADGDATPEVADTEEPTASHQDIIRSAISDGGIDAIEEGDLDYASRFGAMAAPLVPGGRDDAQISHDNDAADEEYRRQTEELAERQERADRTVNVT
jgi:hypothetical protein